MAEDALHRLEARLERATVAAERLMAEAVETVTGRQREGNRPPAAHRPPAASRPPDAGWESVNEPAGGDLALLTQILERMKDLIPPELQRRLAEALHELLLAVRALIDWYLQRLERRQESRPEVRDIPIL